HVLLLALYIHKSFIETGTDDPSRPVHIYPLPFITKHAASLLGFPGTLALDVHVSVPGSYFHQSLDARFTLWSFPVPTYTSPPTLNPAGQLLEPPANAAFAVHVSVDGSYSHQSLKYVPPPLSPQPKYIFPLAQSAIATAQ